MSREDQTVVNDRFHRLKAGAVEEAKNLFSISLYLWVLLSLFSFHKALVLKEQYVIYDQGAALINALVLAKVVLIGDYFNLGERFKNRPLIYPILFKSAIFTVLLIVFHIMEESLRGVFFEGKTLSQSISTIGGGTLQGIVLIGIIMFVVLMPFFAYRELDRAIGAVEFRTLLFGDETRPQAAPASHLNRTWRLAAIGALALALGGGWLIWSLSRRAEARYLTQRLERGSVVRTVATRGVIRAAPSFPIIAHVSGAIVELECGIGAKVEEGQVCAKIDPRPYQISADRAKSDLAEATARFERNKLDLTRAKLALDKDKSKPKARNAYDQAQSRMKLDEAAIASLQAALDTAEMNLRHTAVIAPVSGMIVSRTVELGQIVAPESQTPQLFLVAPSSSAVQIATKVSESSIGEVKVGSKASFTLESVPNEVYRGEVVEVGSPLPPTNDNKVAFDVVIGVPDPELRPKSGEATAVSINVDRRDDVLRAPDQALSYFPDGAVINSGTSADGGSRLWILRAGKPTEIPVQLGLDDGANTEIIKGDVQPGDEVIIRESSGVRR